MIRRPPRSTLDRSSAASDVYKRRVLALVASYFLGVDPATVLNLINQAPSVAVAPQSAHKPPADDAVSYTHLRAHETVLDLVCRLLLEKKKNKPYTNSSSTIDTPNAIVLCNTTMID